MAPSLAPFYKLDVSDPPKTCCLEPGVRSFKLKQKLICVEGPASMVAAGCIGGLILAMIEGVSLALNRFSGAMMMSEQCMFINIFRLYFEFFKILSFF